MSETIFMIHGMWSAPWVWGNYKGYFQEEGYQCVTPTLRYHDMNPKDPPDPRLGTTSLGDYAHDLEEQIKALHGKPIVMGHSMGGLLAQVFAGRGLAKAAVLLTPAAPAGVMAMTPSVIRGLSSGLIRWGFWKKSFRQTFNEAKYSILNLLPPDQQEDLYSRFVYESGRAATDMGFWFLDSKRVSKVDESRVTCPVLVVAGAKDRITPPSVVRKVAKKYRAVSTYKEFESHAHWVLGEPGWQEIADYVAGWLKQMSAKNP